jgi:2-oxo-4-hydroxy-4-carboxy--5-ureidoimidazoline (OHCU) decarboxylase
LCHYPDLVDAINKWNDFSDFSEEQVVEILLKNYSFVTRFRKDVLNNISTKNRVRLLIKHPDLVKEEIIANWIPDFSEEQVVEILWENSSFVNQFEISILRCISIEDRVRLLIKHPDLVKVEVFSNWFVFFPHQQFDMLCAHK